ncbi:MAG: carboxypeptidase regulatory-like domain-containing protein, partial [Acidobacteriota bacterium]
MKLRFLITSIALTLLLSAPMLGQQGAASLTGQVNDASGAAVLGAQVTIMDPTRNSTVTVMTNAAGTYIVPQIDPGDHYEIKVSKAGFKLFTQREVSLQVAQVAKIDVTMQVGSTSEVVEVSAAPPQLDTQTSSLGQVITGQTVADLPLNGRSTFRLIALTPGVTFSQSAYGQFGDVPVNSTWDTNFTINGGRAQSNEILIDGVPSSAGFFDQITTLPIVDETEEFKVQSNNLSAQYGRYSGGVINVTTKSGTNDFHGNLYDFVRNSAFDANEWFQKQ